MEVESGLLVCGECGRWFPIDGGIPELLPDHLRDAARERRSSRARLAGRRRSCARPSPRLRPSGDASPDPGAHYKKAEIGIKDKIDDPVFFGPGYSSPFNPWNPEFTVYLISLFGAVRRCSARSAASVVVDSGCGYAWTTEWLFRSGLRRHWRRHLPHVSRDRRQRIGSFRPHLVVGDVENLPLASATADAILAYESFHHIPDRRRAMASYDRVLETAGRSSSPSPAASTKAPQVSVDAMEKYGILERGMELDDVAGYAAGTALGASRAGVSPARGQRRAGRHAKSTRDSVKQPLGGRRQPLQAD